jgi:hypothetical protein
MCFIRDLLYLLNLGGMEMHFSDNWLLFGLKYLHGLGFFAN